MNEYTNGQMLYVLHALHTYYLQHAYQIDAIFYLHFTVEEAEASRWWETGLICPGSDREGSRFCPWQPDLGAPALNRAIQHCSCQERIWTAWRKAFENFEGLCPPSSSQLGWPSKVISQVSESIGQSVWGRGNEKMSFPSCEEGTSGPSWRKQILFEQMPLKKRKVSFCPEEVTEAWVLPGCRSWRKLWWMGFDRVALADQSNSRPPHGSGPIHIRNEFCLQLLDPGKGKTVMWELCKVLVQGTCSPSHLWRS